MGARLVYVENVRIPTENAHGYQITKMCEAFARSGLEVELWHPRRHQPRGFSGAATVFEYYGVEPTFVVRRLPNVDVLRWADRPFLRWTARLFPVQQTLWARNTAVRASRESATVWYTRTPEIAGALTGRNLPTICELHALPGDIRGALIGRIADRPSLLRFSAVTSVLAEEIARRSGLRADRIRVLPDAVDVSMYEGMPSRDDARRALGLPTDRPIVGYVGRFTAVGLEKGIPTIIDGAARVSDPRTMFLFVGGPMAPVASYLSRIRTAGLSQDRFRFVDRVPNDRVPLWLAALDVALMPSPNLPHFAVATSPLKMFEYMAARLPIVASDLPSLRDVLRHGENAWLVTPDDGPAFARGISALLSDRSLAERLGTRAREDAASRTWDARARTALEGLEVSS